MDVVCSDNYGNYLVVFAKNMCIEIFAQLVIMERQTIFFFDNRTIYVPHVTDNQHLYVPMCVACMLKQLLCSICFVELQIIVQNGKKLRA